MNSLTAELLVILLRRRGGWLRPLIERLDGLFDEIAYLMYRYTPWLPGEWWYYAVGIVVGSIGLRIVVGWLVKPFRDG